MPDISIPLLVALYLCAIGSGFVSQTILSFAILAIVCLLFFSDGLYYALPIMIFYYSVFGVVFGISIFRIYTILVLVRFILKEHRVNRSFAIIPVLIYTLYCMLVLSAYNVQRAIFVVVSILCLLVVLSYISNDQDRARSFFSLYTIAALCSFVTGLVQGNSMAYSEMMVGGYTEMNRFMATFEDPNYMGFFFTIAIFATVSLQLFPKVIRAIVVITLSIMILSSLSMTAIIGNLILWVVYLLFGKKINIKTGLILLAVILVVSYLLSSGILDSIPFMQTLEGRIEYKILEWRAGNVNAVTTGRTNHVKDHMDYFQSQSILRQLFGGNFTTPYGTDLPGQQSTVAHNEYVDELLNVGIIGEIFIVGYLIYNTIVCLKNYFQSGENLDLMKVIMKFIWFYYAITLTVFLDYRFMLPYFI